MAPSARRQSRPQSVFITEDHEEHPAPETNAQAIMDALARLKQIWYANSTPLETQNQRLSDIARMLKKMVHEEEYHRDETGRQAAIGRLKDEVMAHCALVEEDVDAFLDPRLPQMSTLQQVEALNEAYNSLVATLQHRKAQMAELMEKRSELLAELGEEETEYFTDDSGFSEGHVQMLRRHVEDLETKLRDQRVLVTRMAEEVAEYVQARRGMGDAEPAEFDAKVLAFLRTRKYRLFGTSTQAVTSLVRRLKELRAEKQERDAKIRKVQKRLRLIEDRQALLDLIKGFEASAQNPLRLFGISERTAREARFRRVAYPRLLLIERLLRPALVEWKKINGGRPFLYKGRDYLQLMDEELKARKLPRHRYPPPGDMDPTWDDFQYVVQTGGTVDDDQEGLLNTDWTMGAPKSSKELVWDEEERKLLKLGWQPPRPHPDDLRLKNLPPDSLPLWFQTQGKEKDPQQRHRLPPRERLRAPSHFELPLSRSPLANSAPVLLEPGSGTDLFHTPAPQLFKSDPNLLLPAPPETRQRRVRLNKEQLQRVVHHHEPERARWNRIVAEDEQRTYAEQRRRAKAEAAERRRWLQTGKRAPASAGARRPQSPNSGAADAAAPAAPPPDIPSPLAAPAPISPEGASAEEVGPPSPTAAETERVRNRVHEVIEEVEQRIRTTEDAAGE